MKENKYNNNIAFFPKQVGVGMKENKYQLLFIASSKH